jgi:IS30 family transposase
MSHLTYEERCQISTYLENDFSPSEIGPMLGRNLSVISRELKRNSGPRGYRAQQAHEKALERRAKASSTSKKMTPEVIHLIKEALHETESSPQQISGRLEKLHGIKISHESIYVFIWDDKKAGGQLYLHLRHRGKKYNKRSGKKAVRGLIPNRIDIDQRPAIVEKKERFGDFELDTIVGANHKGAIVSIVDRASKCAYMVLVQQATAENIHGAVCRRLILLAKKGLVQTFTADNGKEFSGHEKIVKDLGGAFFCAKPYHSWERGLNEHTNGLVRQYFPKGTDFTKLTQDEVDVVEKKLNNRPRKVLSFRTPNEVFLELNGFAA